MIESLSLSSLVEACAFEKVTGGFVEGQVGYDGAY